MNERIEELFKRAGGSVSIHNLMSNPMQQREYREIWNENIDRFAELIVRECVECAQGAQLADDVAVRNHLGFNDGILEAITHMKKHFGVEE